MDNMIETMIHFRYGGKIEVAIRMGIGVGIWQDCAYPNWDWSTYDYRMKLDVPSIDWSHVSDRYNWLATDKDGISYFFQDKPFATDREWTTLSGYAPADAFSSFRSGTVDWKDSLIRRAA